MLATIPNIQTVADLIKRYILQANLPAPMQRMVLRSVVAFEAADWYPQVLENILAEIGDGLVITAEGVSWIGSPADAVDHLDGVLRQYVQQVAPGKLYTIDEAAAYLGIGIDQMYTYTSRQKALRGVKIGRSTVFTQAELDTFNRQRLRRGERRTGEPSSPQ